MDIIIEKRKRSEKLLNKLMFASQKTADSVQDVYKIIQSDRRKKLDTSSGDPSVHDPSTCDRSMPSRYDVTNISDIVSPNRTDTCNDSGTSKTGAPSNVHLSNAKRFSKSLDFAAPFQDLRSTLSNKQPEPFDCRQTDPSLGRHHTSKGLKDLNTTTGHLLTTVGSVRDINDDDDIRFGGSGGGTSCGSSLYLNNNAVVVSDSRGTGGDRYSSGSIGDDHRTAPYFNDDDDMSRHGKDVDAASRWMVPKKEKEEEDDVTIVCEREKNQGHPLVSSSLLTSLRTDDDLWGDGVRAGHSFQGVTSSDRTSANVPISIFRDDFLVDYFIDDDDDDIVKVYSSGGGGGGDDNYLVKDHAGDIDDVYTVKDYVVAAGDDDDEVTIINRRSLERSRFPRSSSPDSRSPLSHCYNSPNNTKLWQRSSPRADKYNYGSPLHRFNLLGDLSEDSTKEEQEPRSPLRISCSADYPYNQDHHLQWPGDSNAGEDTPRDSNLGEDIPRDLNLSDDFPKDFSFREDFPRDTNLREDIPRHLNFRKNFPKNSNLSEDFQVRIGRNDDENNDDNDCNNDDDDVHCRKMKPDPVRACGPARKSDSSILEVDKNLFRKPREKSHKILLDGAKTKTVAQRCRLGRNQPGTKKKGKCADDAHYACQLNDSGNFKKPSEVAVTPRSTKPSKYIHVDTPRPTAVHKKSQEEKLLGYDWIAGILDNKKQQHHSMSHMSNEHFDDLKTFWNNCQRNNLTDVKKLDKFVDDTLEPQLIKDILTESKIKAYSINDRLFSEPIQKMSSMKWGSSPQNPDKGYYSNEGGSSSCSSSTTSSSSGHEGRPSSGGHESWLSNSITRQKGLTSPRYVRISMPKDLLSKHEPPKIPLKGVCDTTDTLSLEKHCVMGWNTTQRGKPLKSSSISIKHASGGRVTETLTMEEAENMARGTTQLPLSGGLHLLAPPRLARSGSPNPRLDSNLHRNPTCSPRNPHRSSSGTLIGGAKHNRKDNMKNSCLKDLLPLSSDSPQQLPLSLAPPLGRFSASVSERAGNVSASSAYDLSSIHISDNMMSDEELRRCRKSLDSLMLHPTATGATAPSSPSPLITPTSVANAGAVGVGCGGGSFDGGAALASQHPHSPLASPLSHLSSRPRPPPGAATLSSSDLLDSTYSLIEDLDRLRAKFDQKNRLRYKQLQGATTLT